LLARKCWDEEVASWAVESSLSYLLSPEWFVELLPVLCVEGFLVGSFSAGAQENVVAQEVCWQEWLAAGVQCLEDDLRVVVFVSRSMTTTRNEFLSAVNAASNRSAMGLSAASGGSEGVPVKNSASSSEKYRYASTIVVAGRTRERTFAGATGRRFRRICVIPR